MLISLVWRGHFTMFAVMETTQRAERNRWPAEWPREHRSRLAGRAGLRRSDPPPPARAARVLLPDARLVRRRGGPRPGGVPARMAIAGRLPGAGERPRLVVPDRDQRLPGHAA